MSISKHALTKTLLSLAIASAFSTQSVANTSDQEIEALWQTVEQLQQQVAEASEWKAPNSLIHMAGYADVNYVMNESTGNSFQVGSFAPIFHYQYQDWVMLEAEVAFEVMEDGSTEVNMEYFTTDFFINDHAVLVMGKFLSPLGQFRQNIHPSWINKLPSAPNGFMHDQAAPNADVGFQVRGGFKLGSSINGNYAVYMGNGVAAEVNADEGEIEMIESPGMNIDGDRGKNYGGRFGIFHPDSKLEMGISWATGKISEMETSTTINPGATGTISSGSTVAFASETAFENARDWDFIGTDITWRFGGLDIRAEYVKQTIGALAVSAAPEKTDVSAYYAQAAYRFLPTKWEVVARTSQYDVGEMSMKKSTAGVNYIFASNIVAKLAYESNDGADNDRTLVQFAYGF